MLVTPSHILFALLVAITGASAQATNFSTCGQACLTNIVTNGVCRSVTNVTCLCTDTTVQNSLGACLMNCSTADVTEAQQLEKTLCSNTTSSTNGTSSRTTQASSTATSPSASNASSSSTSTSASSGNGAASPVEQLPFISVIITIAGAVIGGAFAL